MEYQSPFGVSLASLFDGANIQINDLNLLSERIFKLDKHFDLARKDLDDIKISHRKIENRGEFITSIDVDNKKQIS